MGPGTASPCSSRSAINRSASACTAAVARFLVRPYAVTPGSAAMSASQRPSSSRKYSIASEKPVGDFGIDPSCHQFAGRGITAGLRQCEKARGAMNKPPPDTDDMPAEIDFSKEVRGLHHIRPAPRC